MSPRLPLAGRRLLLRDRRVGGAAGGPVEAFRRRGRSFCSSTQGWQGSRVCCATEEEQGCALSSLGLVWNGLTGGRPGPLFKLWIVAKCTRFGGSLRHPLLPLTAPVILPPSCRFPSLLSPLRGEACVMDKGGLPPIPPRSPRLPSEGLRCCWVRSGCDSRLPPIPLVFGHLVPLSAVTARQRCLPFLESVRGVFLGEQMNHLFLRMHAA